ncbi:MAG: dienelactone hydrolase family protein [Bdellovibrionota bacterium]
MSQSLRIFSQTLVLCLVASSAHATLQKQNVEYKDGKDTLEGYLVYDDTFHGNRPAVVIIHQWMGLSDHEKHSAERLAAKGYIAFAADIYGKGIRPTAMKEAGELAGKYKGDPQLFRRREKAALDFVSKQKDVDAKRIVFMGYCFGGTGALEAARAGFPILGAASFHGGLATKAPATAKHLKGKLLVMHGALDPNVPTPEVEAFMKEMNDAKADYQFIAYSGAVHAFTQKEAGNDNSKGAAYNEAADRRSWKALESFLDEVAPL